MNTKLDNNELKNFQTCNEKTGINISNILKRNKHCSDVVMTVNSSVCIIE